MAERPRCGTRSSWHYGSALLGHERKHWSPWGRTWCLSRSFRHRSTAVNPARTASFRTSPEAGICIQLTLAPSSSPPAIADRLVAGLDDEILATAVGKNGDIESMLLTIVGIVGTGSDEIDASICPVVLADVERLTGLSGAGEVTLILEDWRSADATKAALSRMVSDGDEVLTWGEIRP